MDRNLVRKRQKLFRYAVDIFIEMLEKVTKQSKRSLKCNEADIKCFDYFVDYFGSNMGEEFVRKFCEYGIQSWFNDGTETDYSRNVRFVWIFGKEAIKRWEKFDIETNVKITRGHIKQRFDINTVKRISELDKILLTVVDSEEADKKKYLNTKRGLFWCIANTTLYFHKSMSCSVCQYKTDCKEVLKKEYQKIYKLRGYGE